MFLDIDGTLLDIAPRPDEVSVPDGLVPLLRRTSSWLGGAVALISGRPLAQIDALLAPLVFPCAGEHGATLRLPDGSLNVLDAADAVPDAWRKAILEKTRHWNGVIVETKPFAVAIHYRLSPQRAEDVMALARNVAGSDGRFEILQAKMAVEIRNRKATKASAVYRFMEVAPFRNRVPVFIGDDVTDHDGFRAAMEMGGIALEVHEVFGGQPSQVLAWMDRNIPREDEV